MKAKTCEICGRESKPEDLVIHLVVPEEVARQAGILDTRTVLLCINCSNEVQAFYSKKVHDLSYDDGTNTKSGVELRACSSLFANTTSLSKVITKFRTHVHLTINFLMGKSPFSYNMLANTI